MTTAADVAAYLLKHLGDMSAMKLQKLVYYSQAWSLVWDDRPMFDDRIEAWANGPVVPSLYEQHRGQFHVAPDNIKGDRKALDKDAKETVDGVIKFYGEKSAQWLSELTHSEAPWRDARSGLPDGVRGNSEITPASMAEYYGSL